MKYEMTPAETLSPENAWTARGLVLQQPYAFLVAAGLKTIETRKVRTWWHGDLVIIAGRVINEAARLELRDRAVTEGIDAADWLKLTSITGRALAIVRVQNVRPLLPEDEPEAWFYAPDRWAWMLGNRRCFEKPPEAAGMQGTFPCRDVDLTQATHPNDATIPWQGRRALAPLGLWLGTV